MPVEQQISPFTDFLSGNHLVLGAAGVGKTRLIWSLLQSREFCGENRINIVLTDSAKRIWQEHTETPIIPVDPYATDMRWIAEPSEPGVYFAACDYLPRVITFLECLANFGRSYEGNIPNPVRVFVDYPLKFWRDACFIEQLGRLHFISESLSSEGTQLLEVWQVLTPSKELSPKAQSLWGNSNLIVINPFTQAWLKEADIFVGKHEPPLSAVQDVLSKDVSQGFYYLSHKAESIFLNRQAIG